VANPLVGSWGELETGADTRKIVFAVTRAGFMLAYRTRAGGCDGASWPRFHHDNASSGTLERDAVAPGKPYRLSLRGRRLSFRAPGDDLLCGRASRYEVAASNRRITAGRFRRLRRVRRLPRPGGPGRAQSVLVRADLRYVASRAVDDQGNRGRLAVIRRGRDCLYRRAHFRRRGLGRVRLRHSRRALQRRAGRPRVRRRRAWRYCVRRGGRVLVAFSRRGRSVLVASTARGHWIGRIRPRAGARRLGRGARGARRAGGGIRFSSPRFPHTVFGVRRGRVRFVAVADASILKRGRTLRRYVRLLGLGR
jgi:hypothetical protein